MKFKQSFLGMAVAGALLSMSGNAAASAFALIEQSSGLGNAFAGGAAAAEDATTIFFNPAGMSRLKGKQVTVAGSLIQPSAKFSDTGSVAATAQPSKGGNGGDAGGLALVPNTYMVMEQGAALRFGLGINVPFGLQTEYDPTWVGRFQAIKSKIQTINLNPSVSYQMNDSVSLGAGLNYQHITGDLTSAVNWNAIAALAGGGAAIPAMNAAGQNEGVTSITGSDSAWGYNLGVLFQTTPQTRVGLAYRSSIKYDLSGSVTFSNRPTAAVVGGALAAGIAAATPNESVTLAIEVPATFSTSVFHALDDKWEMMADATWTQWSVLKELKVVRSNGATLGGAATPENWKDTWRVAAGASYHYSEQWLARIGVAYDQTPVPDAYRTARIPDSNRTWLAFGGQYKTSASGTLDFGYAHLFMNNASIANNQNTATSANGNLVGTYSNSVDILSMQYAYSF
jgi:long-chain fatty acid transport protein